MSIKKEENSKSKLIAFLCIVTVIMTASTVYFSARASMYKSQGELINEKAVSSLCESLDSIAVTLKKSIYSGDGEALLKTGNELCRQAAIAKESLGLISPEGEFADELYRFLSQVGNYTVALSQGKTTVRTEDVQKLRQLYSYAEALSAGLNEICVDYYNGDVSFDKASTELLSRSEAPEDFYDRVSDTAQTMGDYPTLVYDGPFADNNSKSDGDFLKGKKEITDKEAAEKVVELLKVQATSLKREADIDGQIELYCFSKGQTDVTVTKKGGYICSVISDEYALEETISAKEAVSRGLEYLEKLGYKNMKSSYYSIYDGICTINYAWEKDGVVCYPDLIKVSISLETGKLAGLDARPFLLSHRERGSLECKVSRDEAAKKLSGVLEIIDEGIAVIPLDSGKEALCYEFHCKDNSGQEVLVYIDADTAKQRDVLILLYSDGGILTK